MMKNNIIGSNPKVVILGGGTGTSTILRSLKNYTSNITAIVAVSDDGGGSGTLRQDIGILPPGDIRNCITALSNAEPMLQKLMKYRFEDGMLKNQSFGNLFLAAMAGITGSFEEGVKQTSKVLAITGKVLPVTDEDVYLCAELSNGEKVIGESVIPQIVSKNKVRIDKMYTFPRRTQPISGVLEAIKEADIIILGPGSLYTSIIPNLLVEGVVEAITGSKAMKFYICNIMTQDGETNEYTVTDHVNALLKHGAPGIFKYCLVNKKDFPDDIIEKYKSENSYPVSIDSEVTNNLYGESKGEIQYIVDDFVLVKDDNLARHNADYICRKIMMIAGAL